MEQSDVKDLELKESGVNNSALSDSSTLRGDAINLSSGHGNDTTSFEQLGAAAEVDGAKAVDMAHLNEETEQMPKLLESPEPERSAKNGKFNLRKSLAWDSAFFTSDGVLDAEELSTMIGGVKSVKHPLPGIEEEVYRSMDSISTLESDNLTLECLEAELFQDIRASIQKSSGASNLANSSIKSSSGKMGSQAKINSPPKKPDPAAPKKVDLDSGKRPAARIKNSTSSIPQPTKIISRANPTSTVTTKRASLSANHLKKDHDITQPAVVTQKRTQAAKVTTQASKVTGAAIAPRRAVPKPSVIFKSSSLSTSNITKIERAKSSSSCGSSTSSSGKDEKSSTTISRGKVDSKTGKLPAGSILKTPSRVSLKNKAPPANSRLSSHLALSSNPCSSISPASSISEWSLESSSSSSVSTVNRGSTSRGSLSHSDASVESASNFHPPTGQNLETVGKQATSLSRPPTVQPTGLRMPSPKIGFFDGGKSGARTPNGSIRSQPHLPTGLPKTGATTRCSPTGSNSAKTGKLPPPKTVTNLKPKPQKTTSPKPSQEQSSSKPKPPRDIETRSITSHEVSDNKTETDTSSSEINDNVSNIKIAPAEDGKSDKFVTDNSRTPFSVKNSVSETEISRGSETELTGKIAVLESGHDENSEVN